MDATGTTALFGDPLLHDAPTALPSCVHCRTVTWAGMPACDCLFGIAAADEHAVERLMVRRPTGAPTRPVDRDEREDDSDDDVEP